MSILQVIIFLLAIANLIGIAISVYYKKSNLSMALAILEIILVYLSFKV